MNISQKITTIISKMKKIPYTEVDFVTVDFLVNEFESQTKIKNIKRFVKKRRNEI